MIALSSQRHQTTSHLPPLQSPASKPSPQKPSSTATNTTIAHAVPYLLCRRHLSPHTNRPSIISRLFAQNAKNRASGPLSEMQSADPFFDLHPHLRKAGEKSLNKQNLPAESGKWLACITCEDQFRAPFRSVRKYLVCCQRWAPRSSVAACFLRCFGTLRHGEFPCVLISCYQSMTLISIFHISLVMMSKRQITIDRTPSSSSHQPIRSSRFTMFDSTLTA